MKTLISRLLFAARPNMTSSMSWYGFTFNTATLRGRIGARLPDIYFRIRFARQDVCWWLADQLMRGAMRLRGQKPSVFGWYDSAAGNEAARLLDAVDSELVCALAVNDPDKLHDARLDLNRLASLARASWYRTTDEERP